MRYAIGDVQGCADELDALIDLIQFDPAKDVLLFVGDLVNRGPHSARVLRRVKSLGNAAKTVLGNHDFFLLRVANGQGKAHPGDTLDDVINAPDADELLHWLRHQPLAVVEGDTIMVHAGVLPQWTRADVIALAREIEQQLRGPDWLSFLRDLFGNTDAPWSDKLSGLARSRTIVNAFCRLRFCDPFGVMNFSEKRDVQHAPSGMLPWFQHPHRRTAHCQLIAGHWSSVGLLTTPNVSMLDSGCLWGGTLTAQCFETGQLFQVHSRQPMSATPSE